MITSIIPAFGGARVDRVELLLAVVASYHQEVDGAECLIVEPDGPPLLADYGQCRRVTLATDNPFPVCALMNRGHEAAANKLHAIRGNDTPFVAGWERAAVEFDANGRYPYFAGFNEMLLMDEPSSLRVREAILAGREWPKDLTGKVGGTGWNKGAGCIFCIRSAAFKKIGPHEVYDAWMPEDVDYAWRCAAEYGFFPNAHTLHVRAYHLWHDNTESKSPRTAELRPVHSERLRRFQKLYEAKKTPKGGAK